MQRDSLGRVLINPVSQNMVLPRVMRRADERIRWSHLALFGTSPLVRVTTFMPVLGYLILLNDKIAVWLHMHAAWLPTGLGPPGWRIFFPVLWDSFPRRWITDV